MMLRCHVQDGDENGRFGRGLDEESLLATKLRMSIVVQGCHSRCR